MRTIGIELTPSPDDRVNHSVCHSSASIQCWSTRIHRSYSSITCILVNLVSLYFMLFVAAFCFIIWFFFSCDTVFWIGIFSLKDPPISFYIPFPLWMLSFFSTVAYTILHRFHQEYHGGFPLPLLATILLHLSYTTVLLRILLFNVARIPWESQWW